MLYYQVKPEYDQRTRWKETYKGVVADGVYLAGELYTVAELSKYRMSLQLWDNMFREVHIPRTKTYWSFGARYPMREIRDEIEKA